LTLKPLQALRSSHEIVFDPPNSFPIFQQTCACKSSIVLRLLQRRLLLSGRMRRRVLLQERLLHRRNVLLQFQSRMNMRSCAIT
jgi:hypothetical protein